MKVAKTIVEMREIRHQLEGTVGFVPTMGYLHEGHLALVRRARAENDNVVASIFVNPTQFGPQEDFKTYPRDPERDLALLQQEKVDSVFAPTAADMYPPDFSTWVNVEEISERLEGASRCGHFRGVATVVAKLFNIVTPTRAYFGLKDAQQLLVIKRMVRDLNLDLEIVAVPTVREEDGLAISSRNSYLNPQERKAATAPWKALELAREEWSRGVRDAEAIRQRMQVAIMAERLARVEYISIADAETLNELGVIDRPALVSLAVYIGKTRLIDNIILASPDRSGTRP